MDNSTNYHRADIVNNNCMYLLMRNRSPLGKPFSNEKGFYQRILATSQEKWRFPQKNEKSTHFFAEPPQFFLTYLAPVGRFYFVFTTITNMME